MDTTELPTDQLDLLGPKTLTYIRQVFLPFPHDLWLSKLVIYTAQDKLAKLEYGARPTRPDDWQNKGMILVLGAILDAVKAGTLSHERADHYRDSAKAAKEPGTVLRLLTILYYETIAHENPERIAQ